MPKTKFSEFAVDNASILFLSLIKPYHTNNFRISATMKEPVCPEALQEAVNRVAPRVPSVAAKLEQGFWNYRQIPMSEPPKVQPDPGFLKPMSKEEMAKGCFRVYYQDCSFHIELFHAMTDGCGAFVTFITLIAEYLNIRYGLVTAPCQNRLDMETGPQEHEVVDSFLDFADAPPKHLPSRFSYLPPRPEKDDWRIYASNLTLDVAPLLAAAKRNGVTLNTLLTSVLASTVMDYQLENHRGGKLKPVRIMVPVDLRRLSGSRTLRNFSLYTLPTMEADHRHLPFSDLCKLLGAQLKQQLSKEALMGMVSYNVHTQNAWYVRCIPWKLKSALLRIGYRFFGESNSSLTLTNLGILQFPPELEPYVADFQCYLSPRVSSPYGCTVLTFRNRLSLNMSHFSPENTVGKLFFERLKEMAEA